MIKCKKKLSYHLEGQQVHFSAHSTGAVLLNHPWLRVGSWVCYKKYPRNEQTKNWLKILINVLGSVVQYGCMVFG